MAPPALSVRVCVYSTIPHVHAPLGRRSHPLLVPIICRARSGRAPLTCRWSVTRMVLARRSLVRAPLWRHSGALFST